MRIAGRRLRHAARGRYYDGGLRNAALAVRAARSNRQDRIERVLRRPALVYAGPRSGAARSATARCGAAGHRPERAVSSPHYRSNWASSWILNADRSTWSSSTRSTGRPRTNPGRGCEGARVRWCDSYGARKVRRWVPHLNLRTIAPSHPRTLQTLQTLVRHRPLRPVDDEHINRTSRGFQSESQLLLNGREDRWPRVDGRDSSCSVTGRRWREVRREFELDVEVASQARSIDDRPADSSRQYSGEHLDGHRVGEQMTRASTSEGAIRTSVRHTATLAPPLGHLLHRRRTIGFHFPQT